MLADYVSTTEFECNDDGDKRSDFTESRKLTCSQGVDGSVVVTIDSSSYDSGTDKTTVMITTASLTANLVAVETGATDRTSTGVHGHTGPNDAGLLDSATIEAAVLSLGAMNIRKVFVAYEEILAGEFVNIVDDSGMVKAQLADASTVSGRADGFALANAGVGEQVTVHFTGINTELSSLNGATIYYLSASTPGGVTDTPPTSAGSIIQELGKSLSDTELIFRPSVPIANAVVVPTT